MYPGGRGSLRGLFRDRRTLIREDNQQAGKTFVWAYDGAGNITQEREYAYTTGSVQTLLNTRNYGYATDSWKDRLISYNGKTFTYDSIGNPLSDGTWQYTWVQGRQLVQMAKTGETWNFTYNTDGLRTSRSNGTTTYNYVYNNGQLRKMTVNGQPIILRYGADGKPYSLRYAGVDYLYILNAQGDVIGIANTSGTQVVSYTYDAWGNILSTSGSSASTLGQLNPLRYRGYVYDNETGLYYVQTRYYNAEIGRWINADGTIATGQGLSGNNMFAYCGNNPVNRFDPAGAFWKEIGNFFKRIATTVCKKSEKFIEAVVGSFQIEGGLGYGLGLSGKVGSVEGSASVYQDAYTIGLKNRKSYTGVKGFGGVLFQFSKKLRLGLSSEYEHRFETDSEKIRDGHTTLTEPWNIYNCPNTSKDPLQFSFPIKKENKWSVSSDLFIGVGVEVHVGVGGHFVLGWDVGEFMKILLE